MTTFCGSVIAVTPDKQYKNYLTKAQTLTPLTEFGDQVSLRDGSVSFKNTDIEIPGIGPTIRITRTTGVQDGRGTEFSSGNRMAAWELSIPRIKTLTANGSNYPRSPQTATSPIGWQVNASDKDARCTNFNAPADVTFDNDMIEFFAYDWWFGYQLVDELGTERKLMRRSTELPQQAQYKIGTSDHWVVECLPSTANGEPGEGFLATAPDGTKYWFNYLVYQPYEDFGMAFPDMPPKGYTLTYFLDRRAASMLVTRMEDRHGNWLSYNYNAGKISSITASDGRQVTFTQGAGRIEAITVGAGSLARTWNYLYATDGSLSQVVLPDGSDWRYEGPFGLEWFSNYSFQLCSQTYTAEPSETREVKVTTPAGAKATYHFLKKIFGRSYVTRMCGGLVYGQEGDFARNPKLYTNMALVAKVVEGAGLPGYTWFYAYSSHNGSYTDECAAGCGTEVWTDVVNPHGERTRSHFSNRQGQTDNKLLREEVFSTAGNLVRSVAYTYATTPRTGSNPFPWPLQIGNTQEFGANMEADTRWTPLLNRTITQDGATFTRAVAAFDSLARPIDMVKSSSMGYSRTERTTFSDNQSRWVLGQVASTTCVAPAECAGLVMSSTDYDPVSALPVRTYAFGRLQGTLAYHSNGMLASVKDGNNHTTTLADWKRGLPQTIQFPPTPESPNGASMSAMVDDLGQITRTTDEAGFSTDYTYDLMGRLASVAYPAGDDIAWNPTTRIFAPAASAEYGLPPGHWRQTISTGNARKITYYDAMWRPLLTQEFDVANPAATLRFQRFGYDANGRVLFTSYPGVTDNLTTGLWTEYDSIGRTTSVSQDSEHGLLTTTTQYLSGGRVSVMNPRNFTTVTDFQAFDEPAYDNPVLIQHPEAAYTDIVRDVLGKVKRLTRRNGDGSVRVDRQYVYQGDQLLCKSVEPETGVTIVGYDGAGNLAQSAAGLQLIDLQSCNQAEAWASGRAVGRTYDARNRLKTLSFPDGNGNQAWTYTPDGQTDTITTQNGSTQAINTYSYNKRRLLKQESIQQAGLYTWFLGYSYDANGTLAQIAYPQNVTVDYAPNALGQATRAGTYATNVSYYPNGGIRQFTYGNGIVHSMLQNARQLPAQVADGAALNHAYSYDENGNVAQILDGITASANRSMTYDGLDRLTSTWSAAFGSNGQVAFTYDVLGNLKSSKLAGVREFNYWYDTNNRLTNVGPDAGTTIGLDYDVQGNLSDKSGQLFKFDYGNRLREATGKESYRYDGHGRRIQSSDSNLGAAGNLFSMYGHDGVLRYQENQRRSTRSHYVMLAGSLVAEVKTVLAPAAPALSVPPYSATGSYSVTWSAVSGATGYELQESANGATWQNVYVGASTSFSVFNKAGGSYRYQVRACNAGACSGWSGQATVAVELPPSASPTLTAPSQAPNGNYTVSWTTVNGVTRYVLEENANAVGWVMVQDGAGLARAYTSKAAGSYVYRVKACNPAGCGPASAAATVTVYYAPATAPTVSSPASNATGSYAVTWTTASGASSYRIEESINGGAWTQLQELSATSITLSGRTSASYSYRVRGCNGAGCSSYSATTTTAVLLPPTGMTTVTVSANSSTGSFTVSWTTVAAASTYRLEEQANGGSWVQIQDAATTSRAVSGKNNGSYGYRVLACNASGCAGYSNTATVVVSLPPPIPPTPNNFNGTVAWDNSERPPPKETTLSWSTSSGATYYELWTGASPTTLLYSGPGNSYTDWVRLERTFWVRACNAGGCSAWAGPKTL